MEENTQVTMGEWNQWKEDIRQKLQETADNFVYIGYRLKQIRNSGMFGGCIDIFEFAKTEYGLEKSTTSRFMAINDKFSEGGNSLELKQQFRGLGSSKLSEMLTLTDGDCGLITEQTTVREIRELKNFSRQQAPEETVSTYTPLQKCIIDFFSYPTKKEMLDLTLGDIGRNGGADEVCRRGAERINPGGYATHKKGIVFLFMYDYNTGIKYKLLSRPEPDSMSWGEFLQELLVIYGPCYSENDGAVWNNFYKDVVATSQQEETEEQIPGQMMLTQEGECVDVDTEKPEGSEGENGEDDTEETADGVVPGADEGEEVGDLPAGEGSVSGGDRREDDSRVGERGNSAERTAAGPGDGGDIGVSGESDGEETAAGGAAAHEVTVPAEEQLVDIPPEEQLRQQAAQLADEVRRTIEDRSILWRNSYRELEEAKEQAEELAAVIGQLLAWKEENV